MLPSLASARGLASINKIRRAMMPYSGMGVVQTVENDIAEALCPAA
jgi:hypothetical protein